MGLTGDDDDSNDSEVNMAECGACRAVIPMDSASCPECSVSFSGVADDDMGECGACGTLVPIDSKSCSQCGVHFVLDDLTTALSIWMKDEGLTITELFGMVDADNDGSLTSSEVKGALMDRNLAFLGSDELDRFLSQIDLNDDGVISFPELAAALSMPWTPPEETTVLEPDTTEEDSEDEEAEDESEDEDEDELRYTERVLERVMKSHGITDKEAFIKHATSSDKDGNKFLREDELTEAAILWNATSDSDDDEQTDDGNQSEGTESDDDEEDDSDEDDDDSEDDEEDDSDDEVDEDDSEDEEEDDSDDDGDSEDEDESASVVTFMRLVDAVDESGESARAIFEKLDRNESNNVDPEEFKKSVFEVFGVEFTDEDIDSIIEAMDTDDDGFIDIIELTSAIEVPEDVVEKLEDENSGGPAEWQRFLMRNYENVFPILYTLGAIFIGLWLVNAMGILVDGSGGPVAYNGAEAFTESTMNDMGWYETTTIDPGEIYDCRDDVQVGGCKNSLTPFAGENGASSMPAGFYWDGIMFMVLGLIGLGGIGYLQMQIKQMRDEHRRGKSESSDDDSDDDDDDDDSDDDDDDSDDDDDDDDDDDSDDDSDDDDDDSDDDSDDDDDDDDSDDDSDDDDDDDDSDDDSDDDEDGIEIGSRVGVEDEDGDWYGKVVEFDDDEDAVVVKREDDGEEYVVDWDSLFQDD